jgi:hypothetical protein
MMNYFAEGFFAGMHEWPTPKSACNFLKHRIRAMKIG